jgi:hypothetical protein
MQKATIFTIFFSVLVVIFLADFLTNTELERGYASVTAPAAPSSFVEIDEKNGASSELKSTVENNVRNSEKVSLPEKAPALISETTPQQSEVEQFLEGSASMLERISDSELASFGFTNMRMERVSGDGLLFQLLDTSDTVNLSKIRFHLTDGKNVFGVMSEYLLPDAARAKLFYDGLKQKASVYAPGVKINETNSFGGMSFYLNDERRLGTAFLTLVRGSRVFAIAYPKASHEYFKKLVGVISGE